ncbi:MAG: magnesium/cobalt transporter CorA [Capsulimonas sp.]|uniref:magnesium/cobalt transporter CorA n=1 Tax=Capsulimonas sp. TaxID=2494211 RepID=UPI00326413E3
MLTIIRDEDGKTVHNSDPALIPRLLLDRTKPFWLDLESPSLEEFRLLTDIFQFHPIAVEDAMHPHQRAKLDEYDGYFFLTADEIKLDLDLECEAAAAKDARDRVQMRQMSVFLGPNYLVTIHVEPIEVIRRMRERCDRNHRLLEHGADYLLYTLLDSLADGYFPMLDTLGDTMDDLEDRIVAKSSDDILETIFLMKRVLNLLRKHVGPFREAMQSLTSRDLCGIQDATLPYFRDVADHLFRVYESLDNDRDIMSGMLDAHLTQVSNSMNRVMQKLSAVATVFLPITFVTGVFGMNFSKQPWVNTNFWFWAFVMLAMAVFTYWWVHRRRWV